MEWITLNITSLINKFTTNFVAEWSEDDRIFVVNDSKVCILKFSPNVTNSENLLTFSKSEIKVSDYHVAENTGIKVEEHLFSATREILYHSIFNANITPKTTIANQMIPKPLSASWSSVLNDGFNKLNALLAVVSNSGNVEIYIQTKINWILLANLTEHWVKHLQSNWQHNRNGKSEEKCKLHIRRVNHASGTCVSWSKQYEGNGFFYFLIVVGTIDGCISVWKFDYKSNDIQPITPQLIYFCDTHLNYITSIHICSIDDNIDWIIVGDIDGKVIGIPIINTNPDEFKIHKIVDIWTHKDVRVSKIVHFEIEKLLGVLIIKGPFIIMSILNKNNIVGSVKHIDLKNLNISGILQLEPTSFVASTTTGVISVLKIVKENEEFLIKTTPLKTDIKWDFHACHGLIKSPRKILWGVLTYPCKITDHLIVRNPSQIIFCMNENFDPGTYLKTNPTSKLSNTWECIEIIRCLAIKNNTLPSSWLDPCDKYDDLSVYQLRLYMWISVYCQLLIQKRVKCRKLKNSLPNEEVLKDIVYFKYRIERINNLLDIFTNTGFLTPFQYDSLYLMYDAIKMFQNEESYKEYFGKKTIEEVESLNKKIENVPMKTAIKCLWCDDNLSSKPCSSNHSDQRCCITGVQITGISKWECETCGQPAEHIENEEMLCPLCDIPMIQNT